MNTISEEGDEVVISSQFLIDSESSLREALNKFSGDDYVKEDDAKEESSDGGEHAGH